MGHYNLRAGLALGAASSATQVDGGDFSHTWNDWFRKWRIKDGSDPAAAAGHWERRREDIDLMRELGLETYRFSIEWARVEPREGDFDVEAIARLREEISYMRSLGIAPLLTLHHFTNPMWFEKKGGWEKYENISFFLRFAEKVLRGVGDLVGDYITINEPNVFAVNGYLRGEWPPGKKSRRAAINVMSVMAAAHLRCYHLIHDVRRSLGQSGTRVGFALHMRVFEPSDPKNPLHAASSRAFNRLFQESLLRAMTLGRFESPFKNHARIKPGLYSDFHGLNYYTRSMVSGTRDFSKKDSPKNDLGWEIYPRGIVRCAQMMTDTASLPIFVTENGTCDNSDRFRALYIYDHLRAISECGLPVERYYHWCFTDNFEWAEGQSARFGLVHVDYGTGKRTVKESGRFFSEIIKNQGVTEEMYERFVAGREYPYLTL